MRIKLLKSIVVPGFPGISAGSVFEAPEALVKLLMGRGHAEIVRAVSKPEVVQTREPVVETRDPQPAPKSRKSREV